MNVKIGIMVDFSVCNDCRISLRTFRIGDCNVRAAATCLIDGLYCSEKTTEGTDRSTTTCEHVEVVHECTMSVSLMAISYRIIEKTMFLTKCVPNRH